MRRPSRKVLFITYYFPPSGGAGVQRPLKFVKYLPQFRWLPVVLTARNADYPAFDYSFEKEVPQEVPVYRSRIWEPYRIYRRFTGKDMSEATDIATLTLDEQARKSWRERIPQWVRSAFFVPDARIVWLPFAVRMGMRIIRKEKVCAIFSTAPPYTTLLIGLFLHRLSHLPWVVDFRDSWIGWLSAPQWRPVISRKIEWRMEEAVLKHAAKILTVTRGIRDDLLSRHPDKKGKCWMLLPNGYDAQDFEGIVPKDVDDRHLVLTYSGSLYGPRNPESLVQALEILLEEAPEVAQTFSVRLVGRVGGPILERIRQSPASGLFRHIPYVPHHESLAYLLASDVALLIIDDAPVNRGILTGKIFEYIGAGLPILALAGEGEAAELIRKYRLGWVVHPRDVAGITNILRELAEQKEALKRNRRGWADSKVQQRFERRQQAKMLADLLNKVAICADIKT